MMQYDGDLALPRRYLVKPPTIDETMGQYVVASGLRTLATSETQKFGHVTYFWNGNRSGLLDDRLERYVEIPSDRIEFDRRPQMRAAEITDVLINALDAGEALDLIRLNYANGDMVGHTGSLPATVAAVETVDTEIGRLLSLAQRHGATLLVTADHGNVDDMWMRDKKGQAISSPTGMLARTSHTLAPVPLSIVDFGPKRGWSLRQDLADAGLANVASTALELMGRLPPEHMAPSLLDWTPPRSG
jgi:2,3-bisphosphoglycerate-independent phosphoglycerate mutase